MSLIPNGLAKSAAEAGFYDHPIEQSLRLNYNDSAYLSWTPSSAGNRKTFTFSCWCKLGNGVTVPIIADDAGTSNSDYFSFNRGLSGNSLRVNGWSAVYASASGTYRDHSAWYHLVLKVDTTDATAANRVRIYVNGEDVTVTGSTIAQNTDLPFNRTNPITIGQEYGLYADQYLAEVHFIDGTALDASSFGETKSGVWIPKAYSGSYGTNGFYLDFGNSGSIGADVSGNGNNFTANNLAATDVVLDSPTNNFATLNPISLNGNNALATFYEGNLRTYKATGGYYQALSTFSVTSGKWYAEMRVVATQAKVQFGVLVDDKSSNTIANRAIGQDGYAYYYTGQTLAFGTAASYGASFTAGDILGIALDADNGSITFYKNGTSQGTAFSGLSYDNYVIGTSLEDGGNAMFNFGQDSSFAGNKTAQGNTDANGYGDFYHSVPSGYLALCTANIQNDMPESLDPAQDGSPQDHFNTVLYTGNSTDRTISGVGFQPDFVWTKIRNTAYGFNWAHQLYDAVRGFGNLKSLRSDDTSAEGDLGNDYGYIGSATTDGFTIAKSGSGSYNYALNNASGGSYVAWNWKANGSGVSNTDGSITSTVSANTDAGFSIVTYTGNETAGDTVGHGLSQAPEMLIIKRRSAIENWQIYHHAIASDAETDYLEFTTAAAADNVNRWNDTAPTSSVVTLGTHAGLNHSGSTYVMYAFHGVDGFSKFGSYTGNGSTDGPFVYTGFRPAFVMVKNASSALGWMIHDNTRNEYNPEDKYLQANSSAAEGTATRCDFLSNGFKERSTYTSSNTNGDTYIFMAFAENPLKFSTAV